MVGCILFDDDEYLVELLDILVLIVLILGRHHRMVCRLSYIHHKFLLLRDRPSPIKELIRVLSPGLLSVIIFFPLPLSLLNQPIPTSLYLHFTSQDQLSVSVLHLLLFSYLLPVFSFFQLLVVPVLIVILILLAAWLL